MATATLTASPKAIAYAKTLTTQTWVGTPEMLDSLLATYDNMPPKKISNIIDLLKPIAAAKKFEAAKTTAPKTDLPAGKYGVEGLDGTIMVFSVDKPVTGKWAGWTFVNKLDGDTRTPIKDRDEKQAVLDEIETAGHLQSAKLYGKATGQCSICGRTLTDPNSIEAGIGPICATKF